MTRNSDFFCFLSTPSSPPLPHFLSSPLLITNWLLSLLIYLINFTWSPPLIHSLSPSYEAAVLVRGVYLTLQFFSCVPFSLTESFIYPFFLLEGLKLHDFISMHSDLWPFTLNLLIYYWYPSMDRSSRSSDFSPCRRRPWSASRPCAAACCCGCCSCTCRSGSSEEDPSPLSERRSLYSDSWLWWKSARDTQMGERERFTHCNVDCK